MFLTDIGVPQWNIEAANARIAELQARLKEAEAELKEVETHRDGYHELLRVSQRGIIEVVEDALRREMVSDAYTAVHRLANEYREAQAQAEARAEAADRDIEALRDIIAQNDEIAYQSHLKAEADAGRLRAALEAYPEWTDDDDPQAVGTTQRFVTCIACGGGGAFNGDGKPSKRILPTHKPDCARQAALRPAEAGS